MGSALGVIIGLIIVIILLGFIWWAVQQLLPLIPVAEPFATILRVLLTLFLVVIVLWVIVALLGVAGIHVWSPFGRL